MGGAARFGAFHLDPRRRELRKGEVRIRLPDQSLEILAMLVERPGQVVSREEIRQRLWPNGTIVEFEHSVSSAVNRLRGALGDSANAPRFVETVPRVGYRFLAPVEQEATGADPRYRILGEAGRGAMGIVYRAEDLRLGRIVAIKFLPEELAGDPASLERFRREARIAAWLNHPAICTVHGVDEHEGRACLVMEYLQGQPLSRLLDSGPLPLAEVVPIATDIAEALAVAHSRGIVHRDLKPGNIFITSGHQAKILDFGLASAAWRSTTGAATLTANGCSPGVAMGTPEYMSPEQVRGHDVDRRSDIFNFGMVLYEMISGERAFKGQTPADAMSAIIAGPTPELPDIVPEPLRIIVLRCLAKDPEERFESAHDLAVALRSLPSATASDRTTVRAARGWTLFMPFLCVGLAIAIAVMTAILMRQQEGSPGPSMRFTLTLPPDAPLAAPGLVSPANDRRALALSPDGTRLAYVAQVGGKTLLHVRDMSTGRVTPLSGTEGGHTPFFSPDGRSIGYFAGGKLQITPSAGGPSEALADVINPWGAVWESKDAIYFNRTESEGIYKVAATGGPVQPAIAMNNADQQLTPELLGGGRGLLLYSGLPLAGSYAVTARGTRFLVGGWAARPVPTGHLLYAIHGQLMAVPFDQSRIEVKGPAVPLFDDLRTGGYGVAQFTLSNNGTLVYVPGRPQMKTSFVWVDRSGKTTPVGLPESIHGGFSLSPDGRRLAFTVLAEPSGASEIWIYTLPHGPMVRFTDRTVAGSPVSHRYPRWAPDGRHIVYMTLQDARAHLVWAPVADGSEAVELWSSKTTGPKWLYPMSFSPDGSVMAVFGPSIRTSHDIWLISLNRVRGSSSFAEPRRFMETPFAEFYGQISPDGHWMLFESDRSGRSEIYVTSYPKPGVVHQVSKGGGRGPAWSRRGAEILYLSGTQMYAVDLAFSPEFRAGEPHLLFQGAYPDPPGFDYDVTPDGKRFLMLENPEFFVPSSTLVAVTNFFDELKRRVPTGFRGQ